MSYSVIDGLVGIYGRLISRIRISNKYVGIITIIADYFSSKQEIRSVERGICPIATRQTITVNGA